MAAKIDVKDKIDGETMDLSFLQLTEVPMRDMASFRKVKSIDLSTNKLVRLPATFVSLTHLIKLDLSKNQLKELPENFGQMKKLRHLDLFSNQLKQLPLSFCELTDLRFLDLKDNPLVPVLKDAAGDCVDAKACQLAAKRVVELMGTLKQEVDKQMKKEKDKKERDERAQLDAEAALIEQTRREKRAAKELRRIEAQQRKAENNHHRMENLVDDSGFGEPRQYYERRVPEKEKLDKGNALLGFISGMALTVGLTVLVCFLGILLARWSGPVSVDNVTRNVVDSYGASRELLQNAARETGSAVGNIFKKAQDSQIIRNLEKPIESATAVGNYVSENLYPVLISAYKAGFKGLDLIWEQGGKALNWTIEEFPKWKSELQKKFV